MPQQIDIPDVGVVEFPDGMSDSDITAAIQKNIIPQESRAPGFGKRLSTELSSVANAPGTTGATDVLNRGLVSTVAGAPVDIANAGVKFVHGATNLLMSPFGYENKWQPSEAPVGGSEWIGQQMQNAGLVSDQRRPILETAASLLPVAPAVAKGAYNLGKAAVNVPLDIARGGLLNKPGQALLPVGDTMISPEAVNRYKLGYMTKEELANPENRVPLTPAQRVGVRLSGGQVPAIGKAAEATGERLYQDYTSPYKLLTDIASTALTGVPLHTSKRVGQGLLDVGLSKSLGLDPEFLAKYNADIGGVPTGGAPMPPAPGPIAPTVPQLGYNPNPGQTPMPMGGPPRAVNIEGNRNVLPYDINTANSQTARPVSPAQAAQQAAASHIIGAPPVAPIEQRAAQAFGNNYRAPTTDTNKLSLDELLKIAEQRRNVNTTPVPTAPTVDRQTFKDNLRQTMSAAIGKNNNIVTVDKPLLDETIQAAGLKPVDWSKAPEHANLGTKEARTALHDFIYGEVKDQFPKETRGPTMGTRIKLENAAKSPEQLAAEAKQVQERLNKPKFNPSRFEMMTQPEGSPQNPFPTKTDAAHETMLKSFDPKAEHDIHYIDNGNKVNEIIKPGYHMVDIEHANGTRTIHKKHTIGNHVEYYTSRIGKNGFGSTSSSTVKPNDWNSVLDKTE